MVKIRLEPLTKEEMDSLLLAASDNLYYNTLFNVARKTGRRLGEFYGVEEKIKIGEKVIGKKKVYDKDGNQIEVDKTRDVFKATGTYNYGLKVKDIIFQDDGTAIMKTWVLKRRNFVQDETHLPKELTTLIKTFIRKQKLGLEDYLFRSKSYRAIQNAVTSYAKKAGIQKVVAFHSFRHTLITHLLKKGWSYDKIQKVTGHLSAASLATYDHVLSSDIKDKLNEDLKDL